MGQAMGGKAVIVGNMGGGMVEIVIENGDPMDDSGDEEDEVEGRRDIG